MDTTVQSPVSCRRLDLEEFSSASTPMQSAYCRQLTEEEYLSEGETETEKALQELVGHLEKNPESFLKVVKKRRLEEVENGGLFSLLKCRLMTKLKGEEYVDNLVNREECETKLKELASGMMVVHNYSKETRRCSSRLAEKRVKTVAPSSDESIVTSGLCRRGIHGDKVPCGPPAPPPPPPPPMLPLPAGLVRAVLPLKERNVNIVEQDPGKMTKLKAKTSGVTQNTPPVSMPYSVQQELMAGDPVKRLRCTQVPRSPGGTPALNPSKASVVSQSTESLAWNSPFNSPEPLHAALLRILNQKFRNVRSPSPARSGPEAASPQAFSP